jgi:hypothetical protein
VFWNRLEELNHNTGDQEQAEGTEGKAEALRQFEEERKAAENQSQLYVEEGANYCARASTDGGIPLLWIRECWLLRGSL